MHVLLAMESINQSINESILQSLGTEASQHNHSLFRVAHYLVLGDGLILAASLSQLI